MSRLTVVGNACLDTTFRVHVLPRPGETVIATSVTYGLGGKGLNQAVAAARAGISVRFIAAVGGDRTASDLRALLAAEKIDCRLLETGDVSDSSTITVDAAGENMIVSDTHLAEALAPDDILARLDLSPGDMLLMQGNIGEAATRAATDAARRAGARLALNAAPMRGSLRSLAPDVLIANRIEAASFAGLVPESRIEAIMSDLPTPLVAVTLGADGCRLRDGDKDRHIPAAPAAARDTSGAGDVFTGTFIAELMLGGDAVGAARLAVAAASDKVTREGTLAAFPARATIAALRAALEKEEP